MWFASQENSQLHYGNPEDFTLEVPKFEVNPGEVVAIVGKVGSGE
jgi:ABC-type bacteriocin/lantibiotic exporter with double-glycine peptidase domain